MNSLFDTHASVKKLKEAGFTEQQAEAQVEVISEVLQSNLATKLDIAELKSELKSDIAELKSELKSDVAELKTEIAVVRTEIERMGRVIVMWNVGTLIAVASIVFAIMRYTWGGGP
jgi:chromosome segregation ATPase